MTKWKSRAPNYHLRSLHSVKACTPSSSCYRQNFSDWCREEGLREERSGVRFGMRALFNDVHHPCQKLPQYGYDMIKCDLLQ
ncbi:hypothetical protein TELCIR_13955 [Teladorsagia circumcincta]|uniref:Uncharacterized protein n=1 Tax=Teladorsagia circumcincta TaxID=45464 RepID=A0A2G9U2C2_TELCI|nr:hypothetical protein TELCIR_13955 [Teladorsagia circumcincta]